jgi:hypothetical protein
MAYCGPAGIPHTEFIAWSDYDRSAALAWRIRESSRCGSCGTVPSEWKAVDWNLDPIVDKDGDQYLLRPEQLPFEVKPDRCPCCAELGRHRKDTDRDDHGRTFRYSPNPDASPIDPPSTVG